jgi:predicted ribosome quality control (RQC) complex YloA/Tae2 family protein
MELFIEDKEGYVAKHLIDLQRSNEIQTKVAESNYKRVYIFSDEYLCIIGQNAGENMEKYN